MASVKSSATLWSGVLLQNYVSIITTVRSIHGNSTLCMYRLCMYSTLGVIKSTHSGATEYNYGYKDPQIVALIMDTAEKCRILSLYSGCKYGVKLSQYFNFHNISGGIYTWSRITRTRLYRIIAYFEGHLPHQKSLH